MHFCRLFVCHIVVVVVHLLVLVVGVIVVVVVGIIIIITIIIVFGENYYLSHRKHFPLSLTSPNTSYYKIRNGRR